MCFKPKMPKQDPLAVADPNAGKIAAEQEAVARKNSTGYAESLRSTERSRKTGSAASKLLFGW